MSTKDHVGFNIDLVIKIKLFILFLMRKYYFKKINQIYMVLLLTYLCTFQGRVLSAHR